MFTSSADPPTKLRQIKNINDNRKLSRRLTREISMNNVCSMEEYYHGGVSVSVPFRWESEPGTPKVRCRESPLPPLTPPPSYYSTSLKSPGKKNPKPNLLGSVFHKRTTRKTNLASSSASSSSSSSSSSSASSSQYWSTSYSVPWSPIRPRNFRGRNEMSSPRLSCDSRAQDEEELEAESAAAVSVLCFGRGANARSRGCCYPSLIKIFLRDSQ